jgi:hypothetical protein
MTKTESFLSSATSEEYDALKGSLLLTVAFVHDAVDVDIWNRFIGVVDEFLEDGHEWDELAQIDVNDGQVEIVVSETAKPYLYNERSNQ